MQKDVFPPQLCAAYFYVNFDINIYVFYISLEKLIEKFRKLIL